MRNFILFFIFLFSVNLSVAQKNGPYQENYDNGNIKVSGHYENGKRTGEWKNYFDNGQLSQVYSYTDGKVNKERKSFFKNGVLKFEIKRVNNVFISTHYYNSGNVLSVQLLENGPYKEFYESGKLKIKANYRDRELFGIWTSYFETGEKDWEVEYFNGYKQGFYKQYYKNGQLKTEGVHSKNKKDGTEKRFSESGYLEWEGAYLNDVLHKKWRNFDKEGSVLQTLIFNNGKLKNSGNHLSLAATLVPNGPIESPPIYPGCENLGFNGSRKCLSDNISALMTTFFDVTSTKKLGLPKGAMFEASVIFKVNKKGEIVDVRVRGLTNELEIEAIRVLKMLPKLEPGFQRGRPVTVPYSLPLRFKI
ncbi:energy transducer TonB [Aestuariivivens sediminis]|uniref:energy transducer TonB n=1 Tax=Aestuariivivens sediminis TaxID=2913557 RepID=UPI001F59EB21|nr:energy transducer TonB [Aestuariivivens sediminis]